MKYAFRHDGKAFILKAEDGSTVRVGPRHEKYDYVQGVDAGRVIGISKSGRWTNAKDYDELYDKVSFGTSKPVARTKTKATKAKPAAKPAGKAKSSTSPRKNASSASKADTKRIQAMDVQISSLERQVKDLKRRLSASEAKARNAESQVEKLQSQLAAARKTASRPKPSKPKGKRRVVEAKAHVDLNWWKEKDYYFDPGGKGYSDFTVRIKCLNKYDYTRLTKSMVKDAVTSALEDNTYATSTILNGWMFSWSLIYSLNGNGYDSKRGVRVRVLSIENTEHATIG